MARNVTISFADGTSHTYAGVPDTATPDQVYARAQQDFPGQSVTNLDGGRKAPPPASPLDGMTRADRFFAGAGKQIHDWGQGLQQIMTPSQVYDPESGQSVDNSQARNQLDAQVAESRKLDAPLANDTAGKVGQIAAGAAPALLAPAGYAAAAGVGALESGLNPVLGDESRGINTAIGAGAGVAGNALGKLAGAILKPVGRFMVGARADAVNTLRAAGVPLDAAQTTGSRLMVTAKNAADDNPILPPSAASQEQRTAFTRATLETMGVQGAEDASPAVMQQGRQTLKSTYDAIAARNPINVDPVMDRALYQIQADAQRALVPADFKVIKSQLANIANAVRTGRNPGQGLIDGDAYAAINQALDQVPGDGGKGPFITQIRQQLTDALRRSASKQDQDLLSQTDRQYSAMKQIEKAIDPDNQVNPKLLYNATDTVARTNQSVYGQGGNQQLVRLAQAGKLILGDSTPNSGTTRRAMGAALFPTAAAAAGVGADRKVRGGGYQENALVGLAAALGGPAAARAAIENPQVAAALGRWAQSKGLNTAKDIAQFVASRAGIGAGSYLAGQAGQVPQDDQQQQPPQ